MPDVGRAPELWERQIGETPKAYQHFVKYREMDPIHRSIRRLAEELGRGPDQLFDWSRKFGWQERIKAWNDYCDEQSREAQVERLRGAAEMRVDVVIGGLRAIHDRLVGADRVVDMESGEVVREGVAAIDPGKLDAKDLAALGNVLAKMQGMAEDAAGATKKNEGRDINIRLSFEQSPVQHGSDQGVIQAAPRALPPAKPDPGRSDDEHDEG